MNASRKAKHEFSAKVVPRNLMSPSGYAPDEFSERNFL